MNPNLPKHPKIAAKEKARGCSVTCPFTFGVFPVPKPVVPLSGLAMPGQAPQRPTVEVGLHPTDTPCAGPSCEFWNDGEGNYCKLQGQYDESVKTNLLLGKLVELLGKK